METKKLFLIRILDILKEYSDIDHKLTQEQIIDKLYKLYGMSADRKAISANIDLLIWIGYDIEKTRNGVYLGQREFEPSEIQFLIDSLFANKAIDSKHSKDLAKKISSFLSKYQRTNYNYIYKSDEIIRTNNQELFYNIDIITEAIEKNKQISFNYEKFSSNGRVSKRKHIVNPYYLAVKQGKYYLVCNYFFLDKIANCRVDKIKNITLVDKPRRDIKELDGFKGGFDISKYVNERIYMFSSTKTITATLKLYDENAFDYVDDQFGSNAHYFKKDDEFFAKVTVNESSFIYWLFQYSDHVELVEPTETREEIKAIIKRLSEKYNK